MSAAVDTEAPATKPVAAHGLQMIITDRYKLCRWVYQGMHVMAPVVVDGKELGLRCVVTVAAGYHARVENAKLGFAQWYHIDDLRIDHEKAPDRDMLSSATQANDPPPAWCPGPEVRT